MFFHSKSLYLAQSILIHGVPSLFWFLECLCCYDILNVFNNRIHLGYIFVCLHYSYTMGAYIIMIPVLPTSLWYLSKYIIITQANVPTLLWYLDCLYYSYILTWLEYLVPVSLRYSECLSNSYIHTAYLTMIPVENCKN